MIASRSALLGLTVFALGGALLSFGIFVIVENANKPWIDKGLFTAFFVLPVGIVAFFLLGFGLYLLVKSQKKD
jgi:hypothetical protein